MKPRFSDRIGITKPSQEVIQINGMTGSLRNSLWNYLFKAISHSDSRHVMAELILSDYFKRPLDVPDLQDFFEEGTFNNFRATFLDPKLDWYEIYNIIQFIADHINTIPKLGLPVSKFKSDINKILEEEMSGYRFIGASLTPICDPEENQSINKSLKLSEENKFSGTKQHLDTAISLLSQKPDPDYRNSIKESISAIESLVKQITGEKGGGLEKALRKLDEKVHFHGGFREGLLKLYGYTSNKDGIRHAILKEPNIGFDEAKFMLVMCSALINFIISKVNEYGLIPDNNIK